MSTTIKKIALTFQVFYQFENVIKQGDFAFLNSLPGYKDEFEKMLNQESEFWEKPDRYSNFWKFYAKIENFHPRKTNPKKSVDYLIPVFLPSINKIRYSVNDDDYRITSHCFVYPCSLCFNINIDLNFMPEKNMEMVTRAIFEIYDKNSHFLPIDNQNISLYKYFDYLKKIMMANFDIPQNILLSPGDDKFVSISFIDGIYENYKSKIPLQNDVHEWLSKLFYFDEFLEPADFLNLEKYQKILPDGVRKYPSNLFIEDNKNKKRILWLPSHFTNNDYSGKSTIKCYHNNLCMLTSQIKNLLILVNFAYDQLNKFNDIEGALDFYTKKAVGLLTRFYYREPDSYKSVSSSTLIPEEEIRKIEELRSKRYPY